MMSLPSSDFAEILMCMPLPGMDSRGFGEKSALSPFLAAIVLTTALNVVALSAAVSGSEYLKSISF